MSVGKSEKYLAQLDQALCNGNWSEIPELARKTEKHAPERQCFTLAARTEAQIASASHRPTSAASATSASIHSLGDVVPKLHAAIEKAIPKYSEDALAAKVCLAEISWLRDDKSTVLEALSGSQGTSRGGGGHTPTLGWLEVCEAKSAFLRASTLESAGKEEEARQNYLHAAAKVPGSRSAELRRWTERLLARGCMFMKRRTSTPSIATLGEALRCFNAWSDFWQRAPPPISQSSTSNLHLDIPRREVWRAFYDLLSTILSHGLMYGSSSSRPLIFASNDIPDDQYLTAKLRQRAAVKRVESTYESLLLNETKFPKANQTNTEVESWAEQVISNWKVLCGSEWADAELGEGGKDQVGRGVLDILYRAATKTFHSTAILRHLFNVHAALGEFDLAIHAFNSYVEIVDKGKARADKDGKHDPGLDNDDIAVLTAVEAIRILCRYGDPEQAEKALEVAKTVKSWLKIDDKQLEAATPLQRSTMAAAFRAIGVSRGHWARLTFENESRSALRSEAVSFLRQAHQYDASSLETSYALALVLADSRDITAAMEVLRQAFAAPQPDEYEDEDENDDDSTAFRRARDLVPLWHLMALCLTAKDDHEQAARMCEAAFEQFGDVTTLFGEENNRLSADSRRILPRSSRGVIDQMESFEKAELLQVKMSQLALLELMEGAEIAVDVSHELLALYARLFGNPDNLKPAAPPPPTATSTTPSKAGGTLRSLAGSIRPKSTRSSLEKGTYRNASMAALPESQSRVERRNEANGSAIGVPISITVTNEDGEKAHDHHVPFKLRGSQHGNLRYSKSGSSLREKPAPTQDDVPPLPTFNTKKIDYAPVESAVAHSQSHENPVGPEQTLKEMQHNAPHDALPAPAGHEDQPPQQDVRIPTAHPATGFSPEIRLSSAQDRRHKISLLVELWLFIAGLYLRADLYDDASGAIMEAHKFVEFAETDAAAQQANALGLFEKRWGGGKSVDALWADVWTAKGQLASARGQAFRALEAYEQCVAYFPDHLEGVIGLSNILMDIYEEKIPIEEPRTLLQDSTTGADGRSRVPPRPTLIPSLLPKPTNDADSKPKTLKQDPTPTELNRLAARDRAYILLTTLTRLGSGWDNSEAWLTLARAHELSKQIEKAKQALWWVVELEENQPIRPWCDVGAGSFTL